jgi:type VI secretion system secreted protein VgrG
MTITAGEQIIFNCGSSSITLKKDGEITISGKDIIVKASGKVNVKASSDITMKGSEIKQN